ncbi:MAG: PKD domain-containing protein [Ferruginibacter sp.]
MKRDTLLIACILFTLFLQGQDKSNRGKEFWLAYGFDYSFFNESPVNFQELALYISTVQPATVTVTVTNTGYSQTLTIPANTVDASILIPKSGPNDARTLTDGLQNRGIHIVSDVPVAVYAHVYSTQVSGATMLMPVETYGYLYHSINYLQSTSGSTLPSVSPTTSNGADWYSWFYAIASEDNTRLQITPSDTTKNGWLPGQTYTVNLNKGESYHVFGKLVGGSNQAWAASKDMTGSKVVSVTGADGNCHPVALFSGSGGIRICRGDGGEFMHQQAFPAQAWGTRYLTYHTINNTNTDILQSNRSYYRICVEDPTTVVKKDGVVMTGLIKNFYYEYSDSTGGNYIEADKPVVVAQYMVNKNQCWDLNVNGYGDPEMFYLSPIEQGQKSVLFYTSRKSGIDYVYTNIYLPTAAVNSLKVDGVSLPANQIITHPTFPSYSVALARFLGPAAQHTITCDSAINATVYGLGFFESYGYNVGTRINNLNYYSGIGNVNNNTGYTDTFTCLKTPVRLYVKVAYPATSITWKLSQIPGISPNVDSFISNPVPVGTELINGRTYYVYTLQQDFIFANTGTFYIPVSYTNLVTTNCSQTENANVKVVVKPGPVADFSILNANCLADTVTFTGTSSANGFNIGTYLWNFDDGSIQTTINAKKRFATAGLQNIRYRIYADNGCAGDTTKTINIFPEPVSKLGATTPSCDSVLISDTSSIASGSISSWQYLFGDGNTLTRNTNTPFYHVYNTAGTYTIKLITVSNNNCVSDTAYRTVVILGKPIAKFGYDRNICVGDSIRITDTSSIAQGNITGWQYDFGDGTTLTRNTNTPFYHSYNTAGSFILQLITFSNSGCSSIAFQQTIIVAAKPSASFSYTGNLCTGNAITFTSTYTNSSNTTWYWNFGDGQIQNNSSGNTSTHTYSLPQNNIVVKHAVNIGQGCSSDTAFVTIPVINPTPLASFIIKKDTLCENKPVSFTSTITGINTWLWNFGNGTGAAATPFSRLFNNAGTYNISLVITDANGCKSLPATDILTVNPSPQVNAGADKIIQTGTSVLLDAAVTPAATYNYLWTPPTALNSNTILQPVSTAAVTTTYLLKVENPFSHCIATDSVMVSVISKLFIPNAFTPNGDGTNDVWKIPGMALYPKGIVIIFNRYGEKIWETGNYVSHPWDGTYKGVQQNSGSYVYLIRLNDNTNQILQGTVTIIR